MLGNTVEFNRKHNCDVFPRKGYKGMETSHAEYIYVKQSLDNVKL